MAAGTAGYDDAKIFGAAGDRHPLRLVVWIQPVRPKRLTGLSPVFTFADSLCQVCCSRAYRIPICRARLVSLYGPDLHELLRLLRAAEGMRQLLQIEWQW
ncbi:MAG: hypothetical protein ACR2PL_01975 [Dehalococcoidia bacterium]